ncbi:hypothetical protein ABZ318_09695 [Streptomyces sp. NPDC006197]|uniref:hypothetical protein n=1 Tax=Streptomyces sp. NPDC006197 TaxID=3156685 RepID=UPI00339FD293
MTALVVGLSPGVLAGGRPDRGLVLTVSAAAVAGSLAGGRLAGGIPQDALRTAFGWFVLAMGASCSRSSSTPPCGPPGRVDGARDRAGLLVRRPGVADPASLRGSAAGGRREHAVSPDRPGRCRGRLRSAAAEERTATG